MELFFDTETSDKFNFKTQRYYDKDFPWPVQVGAVLAEDGVAYAELNVIIKPEGRKIADGAYRVHQIDTKLAERVGVRETEMLNLFMALVDSADTLIAHNYEFDANIMSASCYNFGYKLSADDILKGKCSFCTMKETTNIVKLPPAWSGGGYKWPKLSELHLFLFNENFIGAHDAMYDIRATMKCYYELKERKLIK